MAMELNYAKNSVNSLSQKGSESLRNMIPQVIISGWSACVVSTLHSLEDQTELGGNRTSQTETSGFLRKLDLPPGMRQPPAMTGCGHHYETLRPRVHTKDGGVELSSTRISRAESWSILCGQNNTTGWIVYNE
jgi:hypothetical protein